MKKIKILKIKILNKNLFNKNLFITYILILINIVFYYILFFLPKKIFFFVLSYKFSFYNKYYNKISFYKIFTNYKIITNFFSHIYFIHIFFNMFYLLIFGSIIEKKIGKLKFLLYYLFTGILSSLFQFLFLYYNNNKNFSILGASGAIYGLLGIISVFYHNYILKIESSNYIKFSKIIKAFLFINIFDLLFNLNLNVGHISHLTGFLIGKLLGSIYINKKKYKNIYIIIKII